MTSQHDARDAAATLARILLDVDVLDDEVADVVWSDEEFCQLAIARRAIGHAERCESAVDEGRHGRLQSAQYDTDRLAAERLTELLEADGIDVDDVAGACPVVGRSA